MGGDEPGLAALDQYPSVTARCPPWVVSLSSGLLDHDEHLSALRLDALILGWLWEGNGEVLATGSS